MLSIEPRHAAVGDGEGAAVQVLHGELAVAGALAEVGDLLLDGGQRQELGVATGTTRPWSVLTATPMS